MNNSNRDGVLMFTGTVLGISGTLFLILTNVELYLIILSGIIFSTLALLFNYKYRKEEQ